MCSNLVEQIAAAAENARNLLSQLGPLVWALHANQGSVIPMALCVDLEPDVYVAIGTDEPPEQKAKRKDAVVNVLRDLKELREGEHPELFTSPGYRDAINRSIVVYAVAVLERFLDQAAKPMWDKRALGPVVCPRRCHRDPEWPADTLNKTKYLKRDTGIDLRSAKQVYVDTGWLVLVRNAIIHSDARAERAESDARQYKLLRDGGCAPWRSDGWCDQNGICHPILVWDDRWEEKPRADWRSRTFSIPIDDFILPRLRDAQAFVGEAAQKLREAAGK